MERRRSRDNAGSAVHARVCACVLLVLTSVRSQRFFIFIFLYKGVPLSVTFSVPLAVTRAVSLTPRKLP